MQRNSHYKNQLFNTGFPVPSPSHTNTIHFYMVITGLFQAITDLTKNVTSLTPEHYLKTKPRLNFIFVYLAYFSHLAIYTDLLHLHSWQKLFPTSEEIRFRPLLDLNNSG